MHSDNKINIIIIQKNISDDIDHNLECLFNNLSNIKSNRVTIVAIHELSYLKYFAISKIKKHNLAISTTSVIIKKIKSICKKNRIYLLFPFYEKSHDMFYNTAIMISSNGKIIGKYRKIHIPNEKCYQEQHHFDIPKKKYVVVKVNNYNVGIMLCWDQWHSDIYNKLNKKGIDLIICPTSIGNATINNKLITSKDEKAKWLSTIAANSLMINTPIVVINRIGKETIGKSSIDFWGSSFVTNSNGDIVFKSGRKEFIKAISIDIKDKISSQKYWNFNKS